MKVMSRKNVAIVVLHYITINDTIECVQSIFQLSQDEINLQIVIVDNASPDSSGKQLLQYFKDKENVKVLLSEENLGFSKGNNIGFNYAKKYLDPDFILLVNNDIVIEQNNFLMHLIEIYQKDRFDIAGPQIISTVNGRNQNPTPKLFLKSKM